jgi:hypothetical protein
MLEPKPAPSLPWLDSIEWREILGEHQLFTGVSIEKLLGIIIKVTNTC